MSSIRVALGSCGLILALGLPLSGQAQDQRPPRDPLTADAHHRIAQQYWQKANADLTLTDEQKLDAVLKGIAAEDRALALNPDFVSAIAYKNILLRMQANLTKDPELTQKLLRQADELGDKVKALQPAAPRTAFPQAPPPSPEFQAVVDRLMPMRIGGDLKPAKKLKDVKPVYPPVAQSAQVRGVVIVEAVIDADGKIAASRVLRSIPLLDEAALAAVNQWEFEPVLMNGVPSPVMMTVTVNFALP